MLSAGAQTCKISPRGKGIRSHNLEIYIMKKWRGVPLDQLPDHELLAALQLTLEILNEMWLEIGKRRLMDKIMYGSQRKG